MSTLIKLKNSITGQLLPQDECSQFINEFFANIGKNLADALPVLPPGGTPENQPYGTPVDETDLLEPVSYMDLMKLFRNIKVKKPSSIKYMKTYVLKDAFMSIPDVMLCLYNRCLEPQTFPEK